jgi:hypothetical protein
MNQRVEVKGKECASRLNVGVKSCAWWTQGQLIIKNFLHDNLVA